MQSNGKGRLLAADRPLSSKLQPAVLYAEIRQLDRMMVAPLCCEELRGCTVCDLAATAGSFTSLTASGDKLDAGAGVSTVAAAQQVVHLQRVVVASACSTQGTWAA
jgi:hypothetical protein